MDFSPITYACGHKGLFEADPDPERIASQIKFYEKKGSCPDCYAKMVAKRDAENEVGCLKALMSEEEHKEKFSDCKFTKVGVKEDNKRIVFVPYKRIAADGILVQLRITENNPRYAEYHQSIIDNCLSKDVSGAKASILASNFSDEKKKRYLAAYEIIKGYQDTIKKNQ